MADFNYTFDVLVSGHQSLSLSLAVRVCIVDGMTCQLPRHTYAIIAVVQQSRQGEPRRRIPIESARPKWIGYGMQFHLSPVIQFGTTIYLPAVTELSLTDSIDGFPL